MWELPREVIEFSIEKLAITGSRLMMYLRCSRAGRQDIVGVVVWDWKTGGLVGLLRFEYPRFAYFTSTGARPFIYGLVCTGWGAHNCHLP